MNLVISAIAFATNRHRDQRRKDTVASTFRFKHSAKLTRLGLGSVGSGGQAPVDLGDA
jgi:hypothetical protein